MKPHIKILLAFIFILSVVLPGDIGSARAGIFLLILAAAVIFSRANVLTVLKRTLAVIPFTLLTAVFIPFFKEGGIIAGITLFKNVVVKSFLSIAAMSVLSATTAFSELLAGLEKLGFPRIMIMLLSFMYRYLFIFADEATRMLRARNMRYFGGGFSRHIKTAGNIIAALLLRALERSERVYAALRMRGY